MTVEIEDIFYSLVKQEKAVFYQTLCYFSFFGDLF